MDPKNALAKPVMDTHEQIVFVTGQPRRVENARSGIWWEYSSKDVQTAWRWDESIWRKG